MRGADFSKNYETLELAKKYIVQDGGVVAIDIAGAEALYPTEDYREIFTQAKEWGIPFIIHAGEADGANSVRTAIEFGAKRIGHGVRSYEDPELLELIKEKGITLEMCPTSNKITHAFENMDNYPLMNFLNKGIKVTINTDDMAIEQTTLAKEFGYMKEKFGLTNEQERILTLNAIDAAFTSDSEKELLRKQIIK